jgi:DNA repair photolyase
MHGDLSLINKLEKKKRKAEWWLKPSIPALGRQRQVDFEFEASLVYRVSSRTARATQRNPVSKKKKKKERKKKRKRKKKERKKRKGKERKGKERKGKERKGKERENLVVANTHRTCGLCATGSSWHVQGHESGWCILVCFLLL